MAYEYVDIKKEKLEFKHIISGPATVGRVLNYTKLIGKGILKHKNGNRDLYLTNNIGSAWCTEFMVGLGIAIYNDVPDKTVYPLFLTENGKKLYELIKDSKEFDENADPTLATIELKKIKGAYDLLEFIFKSSVPCRNLFAYVANSGNVTFPKKEFRDNYFGFFKKLYDGEDYIISGGGASTADNRVPSLIQFCKVFKCVIETATNYQFDLENLNTYSVGYHFKNIDAKMIEKLEKENKMLEHDAEELVKRYGMDGNVAREIVTRNSYIQEIFRNNLFAKYGCKCAICEKDLEEVMIASHIKDASECDVLGKVDYENGLLLCALHDKLFDKHLITFDAITGELKWSKKLDGKLEEYGLKEDLILDSKFMTPKRIDYLIEHNQKYYEENR